MPTFQLDFEVLCACGAGLCSVSRVSYNRGYPQVKVEPCERCLEKAENKGFENGYDKALEDHPQEGD
jgi:hypothetical protein